MVQTHEPLWVLQLLEQLFFQTNYILFVVTVGRTLRMSQGSKVITKEFHSTEKLVKEQTFSPER